MTAAKSERSNAEVLADLARVRVLFQARALAAYLGVPALSKHSQSTAEGGQG